MEKGYFEYEHGEIGPVGGVEIKKILNRNETVIVYLDINDRMCYSYKKNVLNKEATSVIYIYNNLAGKISKDLSKNIKLSLQSELGYCLFSALNKEDFKLGKKMFKDIEKKIKNAKNIKEKKLYFINLSIMGSIIIAGFLFALYLLAKAALVTNSLVFVSMSAGVVGVLFSILQRNREFDFDDYSKDSYIFLTVTSHICFGAIAGLILYVASKANLAFGFAQDNPYILITLGFIAGFSERFIPDMFEKISQDISKDKSKDDATN